MAGNLQNIKFKSCSVVVLSTNPSRILVRWCLEPTTQNLGSLRFFVDRGESPTELQQIHLDGIPASDIPEYLDFSANILDLHKVYYYRVRAVEFAGATPVQTFFSDMQTWDGTLDLTGLYIVEEHLFLHQHVAGVPVMIYKRRLDGQTCPECWDDVLKRVTKSNCLTCYGTGKLAGFYPPYEAWMNFEPDPKQVQVAEWGKRQTSQTDVQFTNFPLLVDGDIIVELKPNKVWKVVNIRFPEKNRTTLLQVLRIDAVKPTDIEYKISVPEDRRRALLAELAAREKEREF